MNVRYTYGDPSSGNQAGRLLYQEDATGLQEFSYGKLGELIKNVRTFVLPNREFYTYKMEWEYDSWNRIKKIVYPDDEVVYYNYDKAGMLREVFGEKSNDSYSYLKNQGYDKFGNKIMMSYANGIVTHYDYDPVNRRLQHLFGLNSQGDLVQNVMYYYDNANNITKVEKSAESGVGGVAYSTTMTYNYDDIYRMTSSQGSMTYNNNGNYYFEMNLSYSQSGNILYKTLYSDILTVNGDATKDYKFMYSYQGTQAHALSSLRYDDGEKLYEWTPNGNMRREEDYYRSSLIATRKMHWDEENRLTTLLDVDKSLNYYTYDAAGERTLKLTGNYEEMNINGQYNINVYNLNNYTLYTSPYMVFDPKGYTKHYYIESDRFVSKIGGGMADIGYGIDDHVYNRDIQNIGDYEAKSYYLFEDGQSMMSRHFDSLDVLSDVIPDLNFEIIKKMLVTNKPEHDYMYWYHKDHLGSSTQISDYRERVIHHIEYMPSGEQFSEQRDIWATPYKFNGKELDAETGLYYYGARYYTPEIGIWLSVDPMSDKYPHQSPFMYCSGNPVMMVDPDGMEDGWYVDEMGSIIGKDKKNDDKVYLVNGNDKRKVQSDNFKSGVDQSKLNDPVEMPTLGEREMLGELYNKGESYKGSELGMTVFMDENGKLGGVFYQSKIDNKENTDGYMQNGKLNWKYNDKTGETTGSSEATIPRVQAHTHNVTDLVSPPTTGGDKIGFPIGVIFDYAKSGHNTYIHNKNTRHRDKARMNTSDFLKPFVTPTGKKL